jgi:hypothetical protein
MSTEKLTLTPASIKAAIRPFISEGRDGPPPLADLTRICCQRRAITIPAGIILRCEQIPGRVRVSLHRDGDTIGVTRSILLGELMAGPETTRTVRRAIEKIVSLANELVQALVALKLGTERVEYEIDYSDPANLVTLLENRDCVVLDRKAVASLVAQEPGPRYYGDIDLGEDEASWERGGALWANRLEAELIRSGAVIPPQHGQDK